MATITTINASDLITNSRSDINTNFANLNSDKIETSVIDTDTALAANSDAKLPSQKAVKTYVDTGGNVNASTTARGIVEEATDAEVTAGTDAGAVARLFVPPSKLNTRISTLLSALQTYLVGTLPNTVVKTYFNIQLLYILWTGAVVNDTTTTFANWVRSSSEVVILPGGMEIDFQGTGSEFISLVNMFNLSAGTPLKFPDKVVILDYFARYASSATGDSNIGFSSATGNNVSVYNSSVDNKISFSQNAGGTLYATIAKAGVGVTNTSVSAGITLTNWNNYRIELTPSTNAKFYINGTLVATLSGANLPTEDEINLDFGRSNTALFQVTAPNLSIGLI